MAKFREIRKPHKIVDAVQLTQKTIYVVGGKEIEANPGDWRITHMSRDGTVYVGLATAKNFEKTYELLDIDDEISDIAEMTIAAHLTEEQLEVKEFVQNLCESDIYRD